jgi:hypothetical protein
MMQYPTGKPAAVTNATMAPRTLTRFRGERGADPRVARRSARQATGMRLQRIEAERARNTGAAQCDPASAISVRNLSRISLPIGSRGKKYRHLY